MDLKFRVLAQKWVCDLEMWVKVTESGSVFLGPLEVHTCTGFVFVR